MATLPELRPGTGNVTNLPAITIASPGAATALSDNTDTTFDAQAENDAGTNTYHYGRELDDTPTGFNIMTSLNVLLRYAWESAPSNSTWDVLAARIMDSAGTTVLAAADAGGTFQTVATNITTATPTDSATVAFDYVDGIANKATWDGAILQVQWQRTRTKGGDNLSCRVYEAKINGTYDPVGVTVSNVTPSEFRDGTTLVTIDGAGFGATQGAGVVQLSDNAIYATGTKVTQTVTSWSDTQIQITAVLGALTPGGLWLWVTNNAFDRNTTGFVVTVHRKIAFRLHDSPHISGTPATTPQLEPPIPKTTAAFTNGFLTEISLVPNINIQADGYTELEWSLTPTNDAPDDIEFEWRVLADGSPLEAVSVGSPRWTIGAATRILTGAVFQRAPSFPAGVVTPGAVTISGVLFQRAPVFPQGEARVPTVISGALFQKAPTFPLGVTAHLCVAVTGTADDYYTSPPSFFDPNGNIRIGGSAAVPQTGGVLFRNVAIPKGAVITSAFVRFFGQATDTHNGSVRLELEAADNPTAPTTYADVAGRARTTAGATWTGASPVANREIDAPAITAALQEVINRAGWASGNNVHLLIPRISGSNDVQLKPFGATPAGPARLYVTMLVPVAGVLFQKAPVFPGGTVTIQSTQQQLDGALYTKAPAFNPGTVTAGAATLTGALFQKAPTFNPGTVTPGAVTITGTLLSKAPTFPGGTVTTGAITLTGVLFTKAPVFNAGTVQVGAVTVSGVVYTSVPVFPQGLVTSAKLVTGVTFTTAPVFNAGEVVPSTILTGTLYTKSAVFPGGAVLAATIIDGALYTKAPVFNPGTVTVGATTLTGSLFQRAPVFGAGIVLTGQLAIQGITYQQAPTFPSGAVEPQPVTLTGVAFSSAPSFPTGLVNATQTLTGAVFTPVSVFNPGAVQPQPVTITGVTYTAVPVFLAGSIQAGAAAITGVVYTAVPVFNPGTASVGAITIAGVLFQKAPVFDPGTVEPQPVTVTGTLFSRAPVFPGGVATAGGVAVSGVTYQQAPTFNSGTVTLGAVTVTGAVFQQAPVFPTGVVNVQQTLTGTTHTATPTFNAGTVTVGAATITGALFQSAPVFQGGVVLTGQIAIQGVTHTVTPLFPTGNATGAVTLTGALYTAAAAFNAGDITTGFITITGGTTYEAPVVFYPGVIQKVSLTFWQYDPDGYTRDPDGFTKVLAGNPPPIGW